MAKRNGLTKKQKKDKFLELLGRSANIAASARGVGVTRQTAYNWRKADKKFADAWDEVEQGYLDACEEVIYDDALGKQTGEPNADMAFRILARKRHRQWGNVDKMDDAKIVPVQIVLGGNMATGLAPTEN